MGRVLDAALAKVTFADCIKFLSESLDKNVKPFVDGWGRFSLRNLINDWKQRKHEIISNVHNKGEAIVSDVHRKKSQLLKGANLKKEEIISNVHEKGEELLSKKKHIISEVQDKGEELLAKKKHIISNVQDKGEELLTKKKQIISDVQDKGEELLTKKKQLISNVQHTGEHFIEEVLDEAKKKISGLEIKKPHFDESARRKRDTESELAALADLLQNEGRIQELNEVDTKMASEGDAYDVSYPSFTKPALNKPAIIAAVESEQYTLSELATLLFKYVRENFSLRRLLRQPVVTSA